MPFKPVLTPAYHGMTLLFAVLVVAAPMAHGKAKDAGSQIVAGRTRRVIQVVKGKLATVSLADVGSGSIDVRGPEFRICLGEDARVVSSEEYRVVSRNGLRYRLAGNGLPDVLVDYSPEAKLNVIRKTITVSNTTASPVLVRWVDVEPIAPGEPIAYSVSPSFPSLGDWGQPVYTNRFFFGVEFPAARSCALPDGSLQMREYPGATLQPGQSWRSHPAVVGSRSGATIEASFFNYVAAISTHAPNAPRPFIYWNGFRVIMPPDRTSKGLKMLEQARELKRLTGFTFDSWTYDAGFDMYRADGLWIPQEPSLWPKTEAALKTIGTPLGFWTSFSCIFDTPTQAWGKTQGYGLQHDNAYCLAEPKYFHAMEERLSAIVRQYGMRSINFDGMYWGQGYGCNTPGHGHLVGKGDEAGVYGTYAVVLNEMRIFHRLRAECPSIQLDLFICNEWASPWWLTELDGVHTVPGDTVAAGIPSPWLRDELITVRDMQVFEEHRHAKRQFPLWAEDLYGNQVRADHLIDGIELTGESMAERWEDEYVMALAGRGSVQNHIVCCDLNVLADSASGLRFLGAVGKWVKANAQVYRHFALLGGEPGDQQTFGYAHGDGKGRAIVGLRNPSIRTQNFDLKVDASYNLGRPGPYQVTMVYPYRYTWPNVKAGESLKIALADFEVALLDIRAGNRRMDRLPKGRWRDENGFISVAGPDREMGHASAALSLTNTGRPVVKGTLSVPAGSVAELQIGVNLPDGTKRVAAEATLDGVAVKTSVHFRDRGNSQDAWVLVPVPAGSHSVSIGMDCPSPSRIEGWLQCRSSPVFTKTKVPTPAGLFPVYAPSESRCTVVALPPSWVADVKPMPSGPVWLGDIKDRCVRSQTGWGRVGWNESCWKDDPQMRIGDKTYAHGLGVHAPGNFDFILDGKHQTLTAEIGVHPITPAKRSPVWPKGSVRFRVVGDGKTLYLSPVLREKDGPTAIKVDITGTRLLSLQVDDGGDGNYDDLCSWGDAKIF